MTIDQFRVAVETDADAAQVKVARGDSVDRARGRIAERLALVAGVQPQQVLVDPVGARAVVRAQPLPGADLSSYRALEARIAAAEPAWSVNLIPPAVPLPSVELSDSSPTETGRQAIATAAWAARRLGLRVGVVGGRQSEADAVVAELQSMNVGAERVSGNAPSGTVVLRWQTD